MLNRENKRKHVYEPFVLKGIKVPQEKNGLKVVDGHTVQIIKQEFEQA